jgi:hypothetical protein
VSGGVARHGAGHGICGAGFEQVELKAKNPWRDVTTHLVMSPQEFMQRRVALVPPRGCT